jgi:hypothetical protein
MHFDVDPGLDPKPYYATAFWVGVVAAGVATVLLAVARGVGLTRLNLAMSLGAFGGTTQEASPGAWYFGFVVVLICGGLFALVYAWIFEAWPRHTARAWLGAAFGVVQALIVGAVLAALVPALHAGADPTDRPLLGDPGFMGVNYGVATLCVFVALHVAYGAMIGGWMHASPLADRYLRAFAERLHERGLVHR